MLESSWSSCYRPSLTSIQRRRKVLPAAVRLSYTCPVTLTGKVLIYPFFSFWLVKPQRAMGICKTGAAWVPVPKFVRTDLEQRWRRCVFGFLRCVRGMNRNMKRKDRSLIYELIASPRPGPPGRCASRQLAGPLSLVPVPLLWTLKPTLVAGRACRRGFWSSVSDTAENEYGIGTVIGGCECCTVHR